MKSNQILVHLFIIMCSSYCFSQSYVHSIKDIDKVEIISRTSVILKTHDHPNLLISDTENKHIKKETSGLKPTFGKDNTGFNVFVEQNNNTLKVESFQPRTEDDLIIYLPETMKVSVENLLNKDIRISGFRNEIEAKSDNGDIEIVNVNGPVIVENARGDTLILFKEVNQNSPISIINSHGDIDITLPSDTKADLDISTPRGELYTDLALIAVEKHEKSDRKIRLSRNIKSKLNGGGVRIIMLASRGNVYLRKQ